MSDDLALALSSGTTPDVVSIDCILVPFYASIGAFADVTEEVNALECLDTLPEGQLNLTQYDGTQYAVPFAPEVSALVYNKEIFEEVGLDTEVAPTTWDELVEMAKLCTTDDRYGYMFPAADAGGMMFTFGPYIWSNGGDFTKNNGSESALDTPEVAEAVQFIVDLIYEHEVTPDTISSYASADVLDAFKAGKSAMAVIGSAAIGSIYSGGFDFEVGVSLIPSPEGDAFSSFAGGDSMAVLADTENQEAAWKFVEYCLSEAVQVDLMVAEAGKLPVRPDLYENEHFAEKPVFKTLGEALEVGQAPYSIKYNEMYTPWLDAIQYAVNQEKSVEDSLADAKAEIDAILAK